MYASTYPRDVSGLVLVDGESEFLQTAMTPANFAVLLQTIRLDDEKRIAQWKDVERQDPATVFDQVRAAPAPPAMPVVVLSGDTFDPNAFRARMPADAPADYPDVFWRAQLASQDRLARSFPCAWHISHTNSDHNIQNNQPKLVSDAIRNVVAQVRQHSIALCRRGSDVRDPLPWPQQPRPTRPPDFIAIVDERIIDPQSERSMTRFVELLKGRPEKGKDLLVQRRQPQDERGRLSGPMPDVQQLDALETLEQPAHGRPIRRLLDLVGGGLAGGGQLLA
jgi:pimeloyl-ACP methyl ester carboxylesterase